MGTFTVDMAPWLSVPLCIYRERHGETDKETEGQLRDRDIETERDREAEQQKNRNTERRGNTETELSPSLLGGPGSWPDSPLYSAAAVASDLMAAPTNTPCCQLRAS